MRLSSQIGFFRCAISALAITTVAQGNVATWNGFSSSNDNWTDSSNWEFGSRPDSNAGDSVVQFNFGNRLNPNNDFAAYSQFGQINFLSNAGSFTLGGNTIKIFSSSTSSPSKIENFSSSVQRISFGGDGIVTESSLQLRPTSGNLTINANINADFNSGEINVYGNTGHTLTLNGSIGQFHTTASLVNRDNNVVILNGNNTYTGGTTLSGGTLLANNSTSSTGNGTVAVNSGATLGGTGKVNNGSNTVSINSGGTIAAGDSTAANTVGTLTTGTQAWNSGGKAVVEFNSASGSAGSAWDQLAMTTLSISNGFNLTLQSSLGHAFTIGTPATYAIATTATITLGSAGATTFNPAVTGGTATANQNITSLFVLNSDALSNIDESHFKVLAGSGGTGLMLSYDGGGTSAAPEPAAMVLAGMTGSLLLGRRKRPR